MTYSSSAVVSACSQVPHKTVVFQVANAMYESLDTPFSHSLSFLLNSGDYDQLVAARCALNSDYETVSKDIVAESLLRKYEGFKHPNLNPALSAYRKFLDAEDACKETNSRLNDMVRFASEDNPDWEFLTQVADEIHRILGPFDATEWLASMKFGPGKSIGTDSIHVAPYFKMLAPCTYVGSEVGLAQAVVNNCAGWLDATSDGNRIVELQHSQLKFVPKDAGSLRSILIGGVVNLFSQKGIGQMMRTRMRRVGIDLNNGQEQQRRLACLASKTGKIATLDLRAASDMNAYKLVELLLRADWFHAMVAFREPKCKFSGDKANGIPSMEMTLAKFSSMGNGYTFELESLIFYAIAKVAMIRAGIRITALGVYGDDLIIPTEAYGAVKTALNLCGFQLNVEKSHFQGYFRESCGGNYFDGREVATLYIKEPLTTLSDLYLLANRLYIRAKTATDDRIQRCFRTGYEVCVGAIPKPARSCVYPDYLGELDCGLAIPPESLNYDQWDRDLQTWFYKGKIWRRSPIESVMDNIWAAKAHLLYRVEDVLDPFEKCDDGLHYRRKWYLDMKSTLSIREGRGGKPIMIRTCSLVANRGRSDPKLTPVSYYVTGSLP